ncbi:hypothetical protein HanRHA438_Chr02g0055901 [Helianthus annuus]|nr:hypothetical protein HanRHA438_Chr02g0055901 [Helianthus annuus]
MTKCPTHKSARVESSCITSHLSLALQPNDGFSLLLHTRDFHTYRHFYKGN